MQYVNADGVKSRLRLLRTGIAQWSVLEPLMFLLYINGLPNVSSDNLFILFANDTTCLTAPAKLQNVCNCTGDWFSANKLALSVSKQNKCYFLSDNLFHLYYI